MSEPVAVQIVTTFAEKSAAVTLARQLLELRLAACIQIEGPIESLYRWQEVLEQTTEWRMTIKTTEAVASQTIAKLRSEHPYDEPEILVIPVSGGSESYLRWLADEVEMSEEQ